MPRLSGVPIVMAVLAFSACSSTTTKPAEDSQQTTVEPDRPTAPPDQAPSPTAKSETESVGADGEAPKVNADALLLLDFKKRVDRYVSVRDAADNDTPPLKKTDDAAKIREAQDSLAQRIRALNAKARHGDIFTPEISAYFKRLARPEVTDKGTKQAIKDDNPDTVPYLKVNALYPEKEPLSTVPPNVLMALPMLPKDIEYRFVGKHLILRDGRANLIIDYAPNVIP